MKKKTRRKFLCDMVTMSLLNPYGYWNENSLDSKKKAVICSKTISRHKTTETGEEKTLKETQHLFDNIELSTVAKIIHTNSYELPGYPFFQISVDCKAFNNLGTVHPMDLVFFPEKICQKDRIVEDLKADYIYLIKGSWSMIKDSPIVFYEPAYQRIKSEHLENQMKKLFKTLEDKIYIMLFKTDFLTLY